MLALVLAMLLCVALGAGVVGYVMIEARREGRGEFWTPEGEELIAGARRTGEKVRSRGEQLGRSAAERTASLRDKLPERRSEEAVPARAPFRGDEDVERADRLEPAERPERGEVETGAAGQAQGRDFRAAS